MSIINAQHVMRTYLEKVVGDGELELVRDFVSEDFVAHTQPGLRGPAALEAHARQFRERVPDLDVMVIEIVATEAAAVGIWRWTGTPETPIATSGSGHPLNPHEVATTFRFRGNLLVEHRVFVDIVDVMSQLTGQGDAD